MDYFKRFEDEFTVFKDKSVLSFDYIPSGLMARDEQIEQLSRILVRGVEENYLPPLIRVYGPTGSGKTAVVNKVLSDYREYRGDLFDYVFVNLKGARTVFMAANKILESLSGAKVPRNQGLDIVFESIWKALGLKDIRFFVLALDEADSLFLDKHYNSNELFYRLVRYSAFIGNPNVKLSTIIIMNNSQVFEDNLGPRVKSSIGEDRTYFPGYTTSELYKIVGDRAKNAFKPDMYTEESITRIVSLIGSESGDARKAIDLLRVAGETANKKESKITQEIVREAYSGITTDWIIDQIRDLPHKYQTVLSNIATNQLNGKKITVRALVEAFEARDESYSQRRVQEIIKNLETLGYLESWIVSRGRHGRRKYIRTIHNAETIENFFEENR